MSTPPPSAHCTRMPEMGEKMKIPNCDDTLIPCVLFMLFCSAFGPRRRAFDTATRFPNRSHRSDFDLAVNATGRLMCIGNDNGICLLHFQMSIKRRESFAKLCIEHRTRSFNPQPTNQHRHTHTHIAHLMEENAVRLSH